MSSHPNPHIKKLASDDTTLLDGYTAQELEAAAGLVSLRNKEVVFNANPGPAPLDGYTTQELEAAAGLVALRNEVYFNPNFVSTPATNAPTVTNVSKITLQEYRAWKRSGFETYREYLAKRQ